MAIDPTPSTVATNALQAIPFASLIGGPLDACIQAQAQAAQSSVLFIQNFGLVAETDENGNVTAYTAATMTFTYSLTDKEGNPVTASLTVPLLTLVPIPYISIDQINIDFMANISASSSSTYTLEKDREASASASGGGSFGYGPYSVHADLSANYSSKKNSTASQNSQYSVEYTMNVHVSASQSSMPAGLQSVLNLLQESIAQSTASDNDGPELPNNGDNLPNQDSELKKATIPPGAKGKVQSMGAPKGD
ncbi:MAG: DUF2589 domain-containing protein [Verrucomicrobiota bacterium]